MRPLSLLCAVPLCAALLPGRPASAAPTADAERLATGLPSGFRRTQVLIYPPIDQRALSAEAPGEGGAALWAGLVDSLADYRNLAVSRPSETRRALTRTRRYAQSLALADSLRALGEEEYRAVRLKSAARRLRAAFEAYLALGYDAVEPRRVARTALAYGLALLEAKDEDGAEAAFREALQIAPTLRLRPGFDRRESVRAFERARANLLSEGPPPPGTFTLKARRLTAVERGRWVIHGRILPDRVELAIHSPRGVAIQSEPIGGDPRAAGQRLASRVWACLPFGSPPRRSAHRAQLRLDAGFTDFTYLESPVAAFNNVGIGLHLSWLVARTISLDAHLSLTNSGRDREEDLRDDIASVRGWAGPGFAIERDRWGASVHLGVEIATTSPFETTTNPACKYFGRADGVPDALCDFRRDTAQTARALVVGGVVAVGGRLRLVDDIYLGLRVWAAAEAFETRDTGLGLPLGGHLALGYRLF